MLFFDIEVTLAGLLLLACFLFYLGGRRWSPVISVLNRWVRLATFACSVAYWDQILDWSGRPTWVIFIIAALTWVFVESFLIWVFLSQLSHSSIPLFPRFKSLPSADGMPIHPEFIKTQLQLESMGYKALDTLSLSLSGSFSMWSKVYEKNHVRVQLLLMPLGRQRFQLHLAVHGMGSDAVRYTVDNFYLPNVAAYPKNYLCLRRPWVRSLTKLLKQHAQLLAAAGGAHAFSHSGCEDLNRMQSDLEHYNAQGGLLRPLHADTERGRITQEGRYRIWKALFWLNYFGRASA